MVNSNLFWSDLNKSEISPLYSQSLKNEIKSIINEDKVNAELVSKQFNIPYMQGLDKIKEWERLKIISPDLFGDNYVFLIKTVDELIEPIIDK